MSNIEKHANKVYRPSGLKIVDFQNGNGGFKIIPENSEDESLDNILEFTANNSNLPIDKVREFAEYLIGYYNHNYK